MKANGELIYHTTRELYGQSIKWKWTGGPVIKVSRAIIEIDDNGNPYIGPFRLRRIKSMEPGDYSFYVRDEPLWRPLLTWLTMRNQVAEKVVPRIILTLVVWNLARRPNEGEIIGWHLVRDRWL